MHPSTRPRPSARNMFQKPAYTGERSQPVARWRTRTHAAIFAANEPDTHQNRGGEGAHQTTNLLRGTRQTSCPTCRRIGFRQSQTPCACLQSAPTLLGPRPLGTRRNRLAPWKYTPPPSAVR
eukprot:2288103-Rhodomonas_salina.4